MILLTSTNLTGRVALTEQACPCSLLFIHYGTCREESHSTRMPVSFPQDLRVYIIPLFAIVHTHTLSNNPIQTIWFVLAQI